MLLKLDQQQQLSNFRENMLLCKSITEATERLVMHAELVYRVQISHFQQQSVATTMHPEMGLQPTTWQHTGH